MGQSLTVLMRTTPDLAVIKLFLLFTLFLAFSRSNATFRSGASSTRSCREAIIFDQSLSGTLAAAIRDVSPRMARVIDNRALARLQNASPEWAALADVLVASMEKPGLLTIKNDQFVLRGRTRVSEDPTRGKTLVINVWWFIANDTSRVARKEKPSWIRLSQHSTGTNFRYLYLLTTIAFAVEKFLEAHPEIKNVRFQGGAVMNPVLAASLKDLGFQSSKQGLLTWSTLSLFLAANLPAGFVDLLSATNIIGSHEHLTMFMKVLLMAKVAEFSTGETRAKNWTLNIPIR